MSKRPAIMPVFLYISHKTQSANDWNIAKESNTIYSILSTMFEGRPLSETYTDADLLVYEIKEQLAASHSIFVQSAARTYDTILADQEAEFIYGADHLAEELETAHLGLFMIGIQEANPMVATNALKLMRQPAHKWQAAVWAVKQGQGGLWGLWQEDLGAAEAVAKETNSKDAFDVGLAQLELELYSTQSTVKERLFHTNIDSILFDLESNLRDIDSFPAALNCDTASLYRLEVARMLCLYGEFRRARQLRSQSTGAYQSELDDFDEILKHERASKVSSLGFYTRLLARRFYAQTNPPAPRSNLIYGMCKIYDYNWDVNPGVVVIAQRDRIDPSVSSLDLLLRAGAYDHAVKVYESIFANDERRGGNTHSHRGFQVQASALMHGYGMQDRSAMTAAEVTAWFEEINAPALQAHATIAERGIRNGQTSREWESALAAVDTMSDVPGRAQLLIQASELLASSTFPNADMLRLTTNGLLIKACYAWARQLPGDSRLDDVMRSGHPAILYVRHNMSQFIEEIKAMGDLYELFISGQEIESLLRRTV